MVVTISDTIVDSFLFNGTTRKSRKQNMTMAISCFQRSLDLLLNTLTKYEESNGADTLFKLRLSSFNRVELGKDGRWKGHAEAENESKLGASASNSKIKTVNTESSPVQLVGKILKAPENEIAAQFIPLPVLELGYCYFYGWGVSKNALQALHYFTAAALLGDKNAQYQVGFMYETGLSVKRDLLKSSKFYRMYVNENPKTQLFNLSWIYEPKFAKLPIESEEKAFFLAIELLRKCPPTDSLYFFNWWLRPKR